MDAVISRRAALGLGGLGAAALAIGATGRADAATTVPADLPDITAAAPIPEQVGGAIGIAFGQVARLSFHIRHIIGVFPPDPCDVLIRIRNLQGDIIAERVFLDVPANHGGHVDFAHNAPLAGAVAISPFAGRIQLVGEVEHTRGYTVGAGLEIINPTTGQTVTGISPCVIPAPTAGSVASTG
jgi:hypothetical protein